MTTKTCRECLQKKPADLFNINLKAADGRESLCKSCKNVAASAYRQRFAEEHGHGVHEGYFLYAVNGALNRYDDERRSLMVRAKDGCGASATVLWDRWSVRITPAAELQDAQQGP